MLVEKYRPKKLDEIIGQEHIIPHLKEIISRKVLVHMLFIGPAGCGKTSTAYAFANELNLPIVELNASDERGINTIRGKIKTYAFTYGERIILLDEADSMTEEAQHALRRIMERTHVIFILTANEHWKIIDPIKSRCAVFNFRKLSNDEVLKVILKVLSNENVHFQPTPEIKQAIITLVDYVNGDLRKALNMLDTLITSNMGITVANIKSLIPSDIAVQVLDTVLSGRWEEGLKRLEDLYISNKLDSYQTINQLYKAIGNINSSPIVKLKLYEKLAETERGIKIGGNPLIQFAGFLASAYAISVYGVK
jgi:replication factor C small subunit